MSYLDRYIEAANFFNLTESEKNKIIEKRALKLLSKDIKKLLNIKDEDDKNER